MFKHQDLKMFGLKLKKIWVIFIQDVGRGSETQLQVGENVNNLI